MDEMLPYGIRVHAETHPIRLATLAVLRGVAASAVEQCRVLELGCAQAGNIMYLADAYPEAMFVGVEVSESEVSLARDRAHELGLTNLEVHHLSIADVDESFGEFDYVIAHGVYSWVPDDVRDHILHICTQNLAPGGLAYISYNVYPGWMVGETLRLLLLDHVRDLVDTHAQVAAARQHLAALAAGVDRSTPYGAQMAMRCSELLALPDAYLDHEYLSSISNAYYLHEFVADVARHGLRYLDDIIVTEAPPMMMTSHLPGGLADVRSQQQYDLLHGTSFRAAVLCRGDEPMGSGPTNGDLAEFQVYAPLSVQGALTVSDNSISGFATRKGGILRTGSPVMKAAFAELAARWPAPISVLELAQVVDAQVAPSIPGDTGRGTARRLSVELLGLHRQGLVELAVQAYPFTSTLSEYPVVSAAARLAARLGVTVANRRHEQLDLDDVLLLVVQMLDGSRTTADLVEMLAAEVAEGRLQLNEPDGSRASIDEQRRMLAELVPRALGIAASAALLVR